MLIKIGELAERSGLSAHTIRYYERIGLLPYADRTSSSHRDDDASILTWFAFLARLKTTGMPIREMVRYAALRENGAATEADRRAMLERHRERVRAPRRHRPRFRDLPARIPVRGHLQPPRP